MAQLYKMVDYDSGERLDGTVLCSLPEVRSEYRKYVERALKKLDNAWNDERIDNLDGTFSMYLDEWNKPPFSMRFEIVPVDRE